VTTCGSCSQVSRRVIDAVNDLDNVLYEIINEGGNKDWTGGWLISSTNMKGTKARTIP